VNGTPRIGPCVGRVGKFVCIGLNYSDHAAESGMAVPKVEELEGTGFFIIESEADLLAKWPRIIAGKPDFIKTILFHSENFARRRETPSLFGFNGLNPQLLPRIVKQAHDAGLRVSTHINTAADFATAVRAGVDEINHLPGFNFERGTSEADYLIAVPSSDTAHIQEVHLMVLHVWCIAIDEAFG